MTFALRRRRLAVITAVAAVLLVGILGGASYAAPTGRSRVTLGAAPAWTAKAKRVGSTPSSNQIRLTAVLPLRDTAAAETLALAVSTPGNAQYGRYLTAAQWRARFAPSDSDVAVVRSWLVSSGFTITDVPANHRYVAFQGTVAAANAAFGVGLTDFAKAGNRVSAPSSAVTVPTQLAGKIAGIAGLDTSTRVRPSSVGAGTTTATETGTETARTAARTATRAATSGSAKVTPADVLPPPEAVFRNSPPCSSYFGQMTATGTPSFQGTTEPYVVCGYRPSQLRSSYGSAGLTAAGVDGRGVTVAVVDAYASPTILADAKEYARRNDPTHPLRSGQFRQILPTSYSYVDECDAAGWYGEETLDVEAVHATAPGANVLYVSAASCDDPDLVAAVNDIVDHQRAQIITNSYGLLGDAGPADVAADHQTYLQAAAQGISVLFSSGDYGDDIAILGERQTNYPASDPLVTAVGGTSLKVGRTGAYAGETGWGTSKYTLTGGVWVPKGYVYGGGGGTSAIWAQPAYQRRVVPASIANYGGAASAGRAVPDIAAVGDPQTGFLVGQTQTFPDGSLQYSEYRIGGTSLSSPVLAGLQAVANQVAHRPLGFLNPRLYALAGSSAYHDIADPTRPDGGVVRVDYANAFDASDGTITTLRTLNDTGTIFVRKGYDDVTGVGTPNGVAYLLKVSGRAR